MKIIRVNSILERYKKYDMYFNWSSKTLLIHKPILVKDLRNIQNVIRDYQVDVKNIIVSGR